MHLVPKEVSAKNIHAPCSNYAQQRTSAQIGCQLKRTEWLTSRSSQLDKLVISQLGLLAQRRLARGLRLNHTEATVSLATKLRMRHRGTR